MHLFAGQLVTASKDGAAQAVDGNAQPARRKHQLAGKGITHSSPVIPFWVLELNSD